MTIAEPPFRPPAGVRSPAPFEPSWEIAKLFPYQGQWSQAEYLALETNRLVELSQGNIKVLEMATTDHQDIVGFLYRKLFLFVETNQLGKVSFAPLPVRLEDGTFREPDVLFMRTENLARVYKQFWKGADLVMEVVSSDRAHDFEIKRAEYPRGNIAEYWIVDPASREITVLKLAGTAYEPEGVYRDGDRALSLLLQGFSVDVTAVFDAM